MSTGSEVTVGGRRRKLSKWLKLAGLAMVGLCTVSIPVTVALALSATGTSDLLTLGDIAPKQHHATPAKEVAGLRCVAKRGYYALTFDDGPFVDTTPRIVEHLRNAKAVATFFDVGADAAAHPGLVELQRGVGQVANHGYSHTHLSQVSEARRVQELQAAAKVLDYPNVFFRAPFEEASAQIDFAVRSTGLTPVYWTVDARDAGASAQAIVDRALAVKPGGIILMHDGVDNTVSAIGGIVERLRKRGMCPGFLAKTRETVVGANGLPFHVMAVKP
jgi:peptidoglycan/xylan/chitin deacetylase (PgdA/CDA1 family)